MKTLIAALAITLGLGTAAMAEEPTCISGPEAITPNKLRDSFVKYGEIAARYGITFRRFDAADAVSLIKLADEIESSNPYPGDPTKVTTVIVFGATDPEALPKSRVFIYRGDDCELFRLDWSSTFVKKLMNEFDKRSV
jgi:hypothetical protein